MSTPAALPRHLAVIMDGNGRWAKQRQRPRTLGHRAGARTVRTIVEYCLRRGIPALTLFAFSSENWNRPEDEVGALMRLFLRVLESEVDELARQQVRLRFIGDLSRFPEAIRSRMAAAEVLELPQLVDQHRVAEMQVGRGRIEAGLDPQRTPFLEARFQFFALEQFFAAAGDQGEGLLDGGFGHGGFLNTQC